MNNIIKTLSKTNKSIIVIGIISFVLIVIGIIFSSNFMGILVGTLGTIIFSNIVLTIINDYIKNKEYLNEICSCLKSEVQCIKLGIEKININDEKVISPQKIIKEADKNIDIIHAYGYSWTSTNAKLFIEKLKVKNIKIRVVVVDFDSEKIINAYNHKFSDDIKANIIKTIDLWKEIYKESGGNNNLEIYLFDGFITQSIHLNEKATVIKSIPNTKSKFLEPVTIYAHKVDKGIYSKIKLEVDTIINESRPIYL